MKAATKQKRVYRPGPGFKESRHKEYTPEVQHEVEVKKKLLMFRKCAPATTRKVSAVIKRLAKADLICQHEYIVRFCNGNGKAALVISYMIFMEDKLVDRKHKWFVLKYDDICRLTGNTRLTIFKTMNWLRDIGVIDTDRRGVPSMQHYRLYKDVLKAEIIDAVMSNNDNNQEPKQDGCLTESIL